MEQSDTGPDERALLADLESAAFRLGVMRGKWRLERLVFPHAFFFLKAPKRSEGPPGFLLRADCSGYWAQAPTGQLWNGALNEALPVGQRPRDKSGAVLKAFQHWDQPCIYHPIDRRARPHWSAEEHQEISWAPGRDIVFYLEITRGLFHTSDYVGASAPAAALELSGLPLE